LVKTRENSLELSILAIINRLRDLGIPEIVINISVSAGKEKGLQWLKG